MTSLYIRNSYLLSWDPNSVLSYKVCCVNPFHGSFRLITESDPGSDPVLSNLLRGSAPSLALVCVLCKARCWGVVPALRDRTAGAWDEPIVVEEEDILLNSSLRLKEASACMLRRLWRTLYDRTGNIVEWLGLDRSHF